MTDTPIKDQTSVIDFEIFQMVDIRVGIIESAEIAEDCRVAAYKLKINFGSLGVKQSIAQIRNYSQEQLLGKQVLAVMNFKPRQVGKNLSEVLVLGVPTEDKGIALIVPDLQAIIGGKLF